MQVRFENSTKEVALMGTQQIRDSYLIQALMEPGKINLTYSHYDRMIIGGVVPTHTNIILANEEELKAEYFLQRREMGIINVGGPGSITADGISYKLQKLDCVYIGKETKEVTFGSDDENIPAQFYILSLPAHHKYPNTFMKSADATPVNLGELATSNKRTIYKYIHNDGIQSCQLVMGLTVLEQGCVWNSVPPHTHTRRMEVYFYFDLNEAHRIMHFMGQPTETQHIVVSNHEAVISAPWSLHFGVGTSSYGFIWGMGGENKEFTDMDQVSIASLK